MALPLRALCLAFLLLPPLAPPDMVGAPPESLSRTERKPARFDFALIGDMPYDADQATNRFPNLIADLNASRLAFVVHDGDIKAGSSPCTDEAYGRVLAQFQRMEHPLVYLPGDNEWSDCGKVKDHPADPEERLARLRALFMSSDQSLGRHPMRLTRQSRDPSFALFRENVQWVRGGVVFCGLNVPGNDNHFGTPEYGPRDAANRAWIQAAFALARREQLRGVMVLMQANPHFDLAPTNRVRQGFNGLLELLEQEAVAFQKPVVLVHGDSHYYRIDQPMLGRRSGRRVENFTRVETFGNPDAHWVLGTVDPADPNLFRFAPRYVRKNLVSHGW